MARDFAVRRLAVFVENRIEESSDLLDSVKNGRAAGRRSFVEDRRYRCFGAEVINDFLASDFGPSLQKVFFDLHLDFLECDGVGLLNVGHLVDFKTVFPDKHFRHITFGQAQDRGLDILIRQNSFFDQPRSPFFLEVLASENDSATVPKSVPD